MLECDQKKIGENSHFTDKHRWENHGNHHFFQHRRSKEQPVIPDQCRTKKCRVLYTPTTGIANTTEHAYNQKKTSKKQAKWVLCVEPTTTSTVEMCG